MGLCNLKVLIISQSGAVRSTSQKKECDGLFAQRGAGWIARGSIGQSALFAHAQAGSKTPVFAPFWASKR